MQPNPSRAPSSSRGAAPEPCLTGIIIAQHLDVLSERYGAEPVERAISTLGRQERDQLRSLMPMHWVEVSTVSQFYDAIARELDRDVGELHWEIGSICVERAFKTVWRILLRLTTDEALVARTPLLYSRSYDSGRLESRITGKGRAELYLSGWPDAPKFVRRGLCVGITTVLRLANRKNVEVEDAWHRDGARFDVSWDA